MKNVCQTIDEKDVMQKLAVTFLYALIYVAYLFKMFNVCKCIDEVKTYLSFMFKPGEEERNRIITFKLD